MTDYAVARKVYGALHEEFDISERFTSNHNNKVATLLIDALSLRENSTADALNLTKRNYRRVKEANRPKSEKEIKQAKIHAKKKQKLGQRKKAQLPEEAVENPFTYEIMSSEDEECVEKLPFITDEAVRNIKGVDRRRGVICLLEERISTKRQI